MSNFLRAALVAAFIGLTVPTFGAAVAEASPATSIDSQGGAGGKVDRDGTQGVYDRDGTDGDFTDSTEGVPRSATQGQETGPNMVATPGWTSKPANGF